MAALTTHHITRKYSEPIRENISRDERWNRADGGLIRCWETGRECGTNDPSLAQQAKKGELPILIWAGGISDTTQPSGVLNTKYGTLHYLAQWQGLAGRNLDIRPSQETPLMCARTGWLVVFTRDSQKYLSEKPLSPGHALQICHEMGQQLRATNPELAARADNGELPVLTLPGGHNPAPQAQPPRSFGSLYYLAQWQGLRGEPWNGLKGSDRNMTTTKPVGILCAASGAFTVFTRDAKLYLNKNLAPENTRYPAPLERGTIVTYGSPL